MTALQAGEQLVFLANAAQLGPDWTWVEGERRHATRCSSCFLRFRPQQACHFRRACMRLGLNALPSPNLKEHSARAQPLLREHYLLQRRRGRQAGAMLRRNARQRKEYLYRKSLEGKELELYEKKRKIRRALEGASGGWIHYLADEAVPENAGKTPAAHTCKQHAAAAAAAATCCLQHLHNCLSPLSAVGCWLCKPHATRTNS